MQRFIVGDYQPVFVHTRIFGQLSIRHNLQLRHHIEAGYPLLFQCEGADTPRVADSPLHRSGYLQRSEH